MKIKLLKDGAQMPKRADKGAAGYDLYTPCDYTVHPGRNVLKMGFAMAIDHGWEGHIRPRSGFSAKGMEGEFSMLNDALCKIRMDADVIQGTIDESYRGEVGVIVNSHEKSSFVIEKGTRIAQMVLSPCWQGEFEEVEELSDTERGDGGFGHSGTK